MIFDEFGNIRSIGAVHGNRLQVERSQKHKYQKKNRTFNIKMKGIE